MLGKTVWVTPASGKGKPIRIALKGLWSKDKSTLDKVHLEASVAVNEVHAAAGAKREMPVKHLKAHKGCSSMKETWTAAQLKCLYTNARSMGNKQEELEAIVHQENYDMVAITETWWDDSHNWSAAMDGYKLFRRDRRGRRGVRGPTLNTVFEVQPQQCQVQGHNHFPSPAGHAIFDTSQDAIGLLGHLGTLLAHIQAAVNQHSQVLLCLAAFQPLFPEPVALHGVAVAQVQDLALGLVEPHTIDLGPSIQPVQVPLQTLPTLQQINTPTQLGVICKLTEAALDPFIPIIDKDIKQDWPQHRALGNTACELE
ncbi:hypothetical protein QYF61_023323 [Mycteria americana]|uniref:Uncharacterized protein n=1 Tax=Mycteria americana TaxID=33587 RepID=A0AAN7MTM0_MYCAM|nr:hypothetical protein QYF61_023323 [Mycteria americana]